MFFFGYKNTLEILKNVMKFIFFFCGRLMERDMKALLEYIVLTTLLLPLTQNLFFYCCFTFFIALWAKKMRQEETSQEPKTKGN